jgi:hypothetical protein
MSAFILGAYCCGAFLAFAIGFLVREPVLLGSHELSSRIPLWALALYAAVWPVLAVFLAVMLWKDAR